MCAAAIRSVPSIPPSASRRDQKLKNSLLTWGGVLCRPRCSVRTLMVSVVGSVRSRLSVLPGTLLRVRLLVLERNTVRSNVRRAVRSWMLRLRRLMWRAGVVLLLVHYARRSRVLLYRLGRRTLLLEVGMMLCGNVLRQLSSSPRPVKADVKLKKQEAKVVRIGW